MHLTAVLTVQKWGSLPTKIWIKCKNALSCNILMINTPGPIRFPTFPLRQAARCRPPLFPCKDCDFLRHLLCPGHQMIWCPWAANVISLLLFQSLEKKLSYSQFPLEVLHCCYKAAIKSPEYAFCLYLQMVSHAIKIFSVSKKPDGKVVHTRIFYVPGRATSIPMCFSPLPIHKRRGVFSGQIKKWFFFSLQLCLCFLYPSRSALPPHVQG